MVLHLEIWLLLYAGTDGYAPCTAEAVIKLLEYSDIDVDGKNVTVIGRSNVIGKPVSMMLIDKNATVTVCHSHTKNLKDICSESGNPCCSHRKSKDD